MENKLTIKEYIDKLSSSSPTPGGGSVAALVGALSSSLTSMVFNLTIGKKVYEKYDDNIKAEIDGALKICKECNEVMLRFMDKDEEGFLSVMKAFKLPKNTEEERILRSIAIQNSYKIALKVPFDILKKGLEFYKCIFIAAKYGNLNVITDTGIAAILLYSSLESSILNVKINLSGIKDEEYKVKIASECDNILKEAMDYKIKIMDIVNSSIK